ncbi:peptidylprolyl isomerase [Enterococcus alcedinis]|uniref:Peptidyl-prolyl cis-trans isomerase n=1 Tax=Enterococcus alcedinis TaxID=1274384 RepID=A0A917N3X5_9ENTE|nr:peptidylprolyl isomerase [Enterococcus alcedinis]MBP2100836.1 peptidyl-prolyl cis-trans isomerase A (cyclophilin A) [Enterococcus alcedinis]GGI64866.1 peptidyl-prolyl cis-trans isomerase [Enterococcus alcedinis]
MKKKNLVMLSATLLTAIALAACSPSTDSSAENSETTPSSSIDLSQVELPQLDNEIKENESVVEITTSKGKITVKLFPDIAPKAVENFVTHAKDGYYDGTTFHRIIEEFMIQGGDPNGDGTGGESIWGEGFTVEKSNQLYHIRGALSMARAQALDSQGSQFFIVQNTQDMTKDLAIQFTPEKIIEAYKNGGFPSLDGEYTVFGQVIDGMDVVDEIAKVETGANDIPTEEVTIESMKVIQEAK